MQILVKDARVIAIAHGITFGVFDEPFEKWKLENENGELMYYVIDQDFELVKDVVIPEDYEDGKYFYENGEFVLNEDWRPYMSMEDRLSQLEEENQFLVDCILEMSEMIYAQVNLYNTFWKGR